MRAASLNSWSSCLLQTQSLQLIWHGKGSSAAKRSYAAQLAHAAKGERPAACVTVDEALQGPEGWPAVLWSHLADGPAAFPRLRLVTLRPTAPRLFLISTVGGLWQVSK